MLQKAIMAILAKERLEIVDYQRIERIAALAQETQARLDDARAAQ
jgi:hypothetical protein